MSETAAKADIEDLGEVVSSSNTQIGDWVLCKCKTLKNILLTFYYNTSEAIAADVVVWLVLRKNVLPTYIRWLLF